MPENKKHQKVYNCQTFYAELVLFCVSVNCKTEKFWIEVLIFCLFFTKSVSNILCKSYVHD